MVNKTFSLILVFTFAAIFLTGQAFAYEKEKGNKVSKKDVPAAVLSAFEKAYPSAKIKEIEKKTDSSEVVSYEIELKNGKLKKEAIYSAEGGLIKAKEEIAQTDLPEAVKKALEAQYPKGKIKEADKTEHNGNIEFEVDVTTGKNKEEVILDPAGKIISSKKDTGDKDEGENDHDDKDE